MAILSQQLPRRIQATIVLGLSLTLTLGLQAIQETRERSDTKRPPNAHGGTKDYQN